MSRRCSHPSRPGMVTCAFLTLLVELLVPSAAASTAPSAGAPNPLGPALHSPKRTALGNLDWRDDWDALPICEPPHPLDTQSWQVDRDLLESGHRVPPSARRIPSPRTHRVGTRAVAPVLPHGGGSAWGTRSLRLEVVNGHWGPDSLQESELSSCRARLGGVNLVVQNLPGSVAAFVMSPSAISFPMPMVSTWLGEPPERSMTQFWTVLRSMTGLSPVSAVPQPVRKTATEARDVILLLEIVGAKRRNLDGTSVPAGAPVAWLVNGTRQPLDGVRPRTEDERAAVAAWDVAPSQADADGRETCEWPREAPVEDHGIAPVDIEMSLPPRHAQSWSRGLPPLDLHPGERAWVRLRVRDLGVIHRGKRIDPLCSPWVVVEGDAGGAHGDVTR